LPPPHILRRYFTIAYPFQLVVADPKKLRKIAKHARKLVDSRNGDPVMAISSMRIVLTPAAVGEIVDQAPTEDVTGRRLSFDELMARMGAESTSPLGPARLSELLAAREPAELGALPRQELDESDLIRDGWDWHLKETRLVEAWDVFGGPENIDWKDIRVGQMDTGFRRIPALGFENADSPRSGFVLLVEAEAEDPVAHRRAGGQVTESHRVALDPGVESEDIEQLHPAETQHQQRDAGGTGMPPPTPSLGGRQFHELPEQRWPALERADECVEVIGETRIVDGMSLTAGKTG